MLRHPRWLKDGRRGRGPGLALMAALGLGLRVNPLDASAMAQQSRPAAGSAREIPQDLEIANQHFLNRRYRDAVEGYEAFLKTGGISVADRADAQYGLASALLFLNRTKESREGFEAFLKVAPGTHPAFATAIFRIGEASYFLNDYPAARLALERFLREAGAREERYLDSAYAYLGDVLVGQARANPDQSQASDLWNRARDAYEKALKRNPPGALTFRSKLGLGGALFALKKVEEAKAVLEDLARTGAENWKDRAYYQLGLIEVNAGRDADAIRAFEALEKAAPRSRLIPDARFQSAEAWLRLKDPGAAASLFNAVAADPTSSPALAGEAADAQGRAWIAAGQPARALESIDQALSRFPNPPVSSLLTIRASEALVALKRDADARQRLDRLVESGGDTDPYVAQAALRSAGLALDAGEHAPARATVQAFLKRFPSHPQAAEARLVEARAALAGGAARDAIAILNDLIGGAPPDARTLEAARYYLGLAYRNEKQSDKAIATLETLVQSAPKDRDGGLVSDARFLLGQEYMNTRAFAKAIPLFEAYLATPGGKPPEYADYAMAYLASAQVEAGQLVEARATVDRLRREFPKSPTLGPLQIRLGQAEMASSPEKADALYLATATSETAATPARVEAYWALGWSRLKKKEFQGAAEAFESLIGLDPRSPRAPDAALGRASALRLAGQDAAAIAAYDRAAALPQVAGRALLGKARALSASGKPAESAAAYARLAGDFASFEPELSKTASLDALLSEWGWTLIDANAGAEADAVFGRLLKEFPDAPTANDARINLAESAFAAGKHDVVATLLGPLVAEGSKAEPRQIRSALFRLGRSRFDAKDWSAAAKLFDRLAADPQGKFAAEARFWKAECAFQQSDPKAAEAELAGLIAEIKDRATEPPLRELLNTARGRRALCLVQLERWKDALNTSDEFLKDSPNDPGAPEAHYTRGRALQGQARFEDARKEFDLVIAARKNSELAAQAQFMRGETFFHQKNYAEARREFFKVAYGVALPRWQSLALLEAGKVQEQLDQWPEAVATYEEILAKHPDEAAARTAAERLAVARKRVPAAVATDADP